MVQEIQIKKIISSIQDNDVRHFLSSAIHFRNMITREKKNIFFLSSEESKQIQERRNLKEKI